MAAASPRKKWVFRLLLLSISLAFVAIVAEIGARVWLMFIADERATYLYATLAQTEAKGIHPRLVRHRFLGYVTTPNYTRGDEDGHNSWGFRDEEFPKEKPAGEFRIICIGSSTTYSSTVKDRRMSYPALLGEELHKRGYSNVRVINAGVPGWTSWECLIYFQIWLLEFSPDMIIIYEGYNDIRPRMVWPPENYKSDNSGMLAPYSGELAGGFLERSTFIRIIMVKQGWTLPHTAIERVWDRPHENYYGEEFTQQAMKGDYPQGFFKEVSVEKMLEANPPKYFRNNIDNLVRLAKSREIKVMLASFAYTTGIKDDGFILAPVVQSAIAETNAIVKQIAETHGAAYYDFAAEMPDNIGYYNDGIHNSETGCQKKAELFAAFIDQNGLIPKSANP